MRSDTYKQTENSNDISISTSIYKARAHTLMRIRSRRLQRGFDLIQLGLVVALIGLLMVGALYGVPKLVENIRLGQQSDDLRTFMTQSQAHFPLFRNAEITAANVHAAALFPANETTGSSSTSPKYLSRFGGTIEISTVPADRLIKITVPDLPNVGACTKIAAQLSGVAHGIKVGATEATSVNGRLDMSKVTDACNALNGTGDKAAKQNVVIDVKV